jgi:hypothetical protein
MATSMPPAEAVQLHVESVCSGEFKVELCVSMRFWVLSVQFLAGRRINGDSVG